MRIPMLLFAAGAVFGLTACGSGGQASASGADSVQQPDGNLTLARDSRSTEPYDGIAPDEVLRFTGTEPFWGGEVTGNALVYSTPENQDGSPIAVERFAGRGGLAFSGELEQRAFEMMVTPLRCSDGMSDRTYPFTVTLQVKGETRSGCGWTDARPFVGPENP